MNDVKRLVIAVAVIHDSRHEMTPLSWLTAFAATVAAHSHERPQWADIMR